MVTISADAVRQFNDQGYCAPIRALTSEEAANLRDRPTKTTSPGALPIRARATGET